jgi:aspartate dehydrogenase
VGALWGADDIKRMADRGTLKGLKLTMKKHPSSLKIDTDARAKLVKETGKEDGNRIISYQWWSMM